MCQTLGAVLIAANHTVDAETVYRKDLKLFPENGRSLAKSLKAQGKTQEASSSTKALCNRLENADFSLTLEQL
jgi:spore germination protein YaaH